MPEKNLQIADKKDTLIVLLKGISKEEKEKLQKAYQHAKIVEEEKLEDLSEEEKKYFSTISLSGVEKSDPQKAADLLSNFFDKDKTYKIILVFREPSGFTEEQKKAYAGKLKEILEAKGIHLSDVSYKNQKPKSNKVIPNKNQKSKSSEMKNTLARSKKSQELKDQISKTFGRVKKTQRGSYTI